MKTRAGQKIRLTSVEELLGVANEESAMDLEIAKIRPFKDHPFNPELALATARLGLELNVLFF